jgi:RNA polymerase sigma-70 factor (ECF subfamily)
LEQTIQNIHYELIERCRAGEREAFYKIYKLYAKAMYNVAFRITGNEDDAEDVLQESFISAFKNLHSFRADASFGSWLKKIVVNKAINILQKRKLDPLPESEDWDVAEEETPIEYGNGLTVEGVKRAIDQLPDGYRSVLSLYLLEGYDHQEIAEIMGITESTSKSQLNRAKGKLRDLLSKPGITIIP